MTTPIHPLRALRAARLLTQAQLARDARVALRTINNIERWHGCRNETKRRILRALKIEFERHAEMFPAEMPSEGAVEAVGE